jgi:hypothetical protein
MGEAREPYPTDKARRGEIISERLLAERSSLQAWSVPFC